MTERRLLPVLTAPPTTRHGSRSLMTCKFRCGNACDHREPNTSDNTHIGEILAAAITRRSILQGSAAGAATLVITGASGSLAAASATGSRSATDTTGPAALEFKPVRPNKRDKVTVPDGYRYDVIARWGDPVVAGAPAFDVYNQTPKAQSMQFGYNCDYVGLVKMPGERGKAIMAVNHEYTDEVLMFPDGYNDALIKRIAMQAHGMSVIEIHRGREPGSWRRTRPANTRYNRRITATTPMRLTGPAAGDRRLRTSADTTGRHVLGMLNNCAGGETPWGTILTGEENFNQYFDASGELDSRYTESYDRYGLTGEDSRGWSEVDERFDLTNEPHEPFRFGYIVEVDVLNPDSTPKKRTMLGRMKHEGATIEISDTGRVVAYMGDDERGDYIYKFVSRDDYDSSGTKAARGHNLHLLNRGTLYVARFNGDGTDDGLYDGSGVWIPLTSDTESFVSGFSVADVLIDTRLAADKVNPTRMDRPEDIQANPVTGKVYCALTNNSDRGVEYPTDEANPLASSLVREELRGPLVTASGNRNGYVMEITERHNDHAAESFRWVLFLVCGDPEDPRTYFGGFPKDRVSPISSPDNVAFDEVGNLWISTDGNALGSNDGLFAVPVEGSQRGHVRQFLTVPVGAETCGPLIKGETVFVAVQHPGEVDGATFDNPASTWPHTDPFPRPSVICSYRFDQ
ncbi:MAG: PhoX family phosphatase [Actinomycetota bacterium]|nr:PhoX family phosphatase [Actinomycetota bacterium]